MTQSLLIGILFAFLMAGQGPERWDYDNTGTYFTVHLTITDGTSTLELLRLGVRERDFSIAAPPAPPPGALHAWFEGPGTGYFELFKTRSVESKKWVLNYTEGTTGNLTLSWDDDNLPAGLSLRDIEGTVLVNMNESSFFNFLVSEHPVLEIWYETGF